MPQTRVSTSCKATGNASRAAESVGGTPKFGVPPGQSATTPFCSIWTGGSQPLYREEVRSKCDGHGGNSCAPLGHTHDPLTHSLLVPKQGLLHAPQCWTVLAMFLQTIFFLSVLQFCRPALGSWELHEGRVPKKDRQQPKADRALKPSYIREADGCRLANGSRDLREREPNKKSCKAWRRKGTTNAPPAQDILGAAQGAAQVRIKPLHLDCSHMSYCYRLLPLQCTRCHISCRFQSHTPTVSLLISTKDTCQAIPPPPFSQGHLSK
jgi:hypothetical protein